MFTIPTTTLRKIPGAWGATARHVIHYGYHLAVTRSLSHITDDPDPEIPAVVVPFDWWVSNLGNEDPPDDGAVRSRHGDLVTVKSGQASEARGRLPEILDGAAYRNTHTTLYRYRQRALVFMPADTYGHWTGVPIELSQRADFVRDIEDAAQPSSQSDTPMSDHD